MVSKQEEEDNLRHHVVHRVNFVKIVAFVDCLCGMIVWAIRGSEYTIAIKINYTR